MAIGDYPLEYNPKVHGPYDPARYYGKPDTPLSQVKLGELTQWFGRRRKTPNAAIAACSRAFWRWQHKYVQPVRTGVAPYLQVSVGAMILFYYFNYDNMKSHRRFHYH